MSAVRRNDVAPLDKGGYRLTWDGRTVTMPATSPRGEWDWSGFIDECSLGQELLTMAHHKNELGSHVRITLVPRPDNSYEEWAISISIPPDGRPLDDRRAGYLSAGVLGHQGRKDFHALARYSQGEVNCTLILDDDGSFNALALPEEHVVAESIDAFLRAPSIPPLASQPSLDTLLGIDPDLLQLTAEMLHHISTFPEEAHPVGPLRLVTETQGVRARRLGIRDSTTLDRLGHIADGHLYLADERHRDAVLRFLDAEGLQVAHPADGAIPDSLIGDAWPRERVPNLHAFWREEGLDIRPHVPGHEGQQITVAQYNPTTRVLYIEGYDFVGPCLRYAARVGLPVNGIRLPTRNWRLDPQIRYSERRDLPKKPEEVGRPWSLTLLEEVKELVPSGVLPTHRITWVTLQGSNGFRCAPEHDFALLETHVDSRRYFFRGANRLPATRPCRLCGAPATAFTHPGAIGALSYCQACLEHADNGVFDSIEGTVAAVRHLSLFEFRGNPPLETQLATIHFPVEAPVDARHVDALLLARFAVRRRRHPWTHVLLAAGLLDEGVRTSMGTTIAAMDGHLCLSLQEKAVDDFFHLAGMAHEREPFYPFDPDLNPRTKRRADWVLADGTFVEMWGLPNDPTYALHMEEKTALARHHGIRLIGLTAADIPRLRTLFADKIQELAAAPNNIPDPRTLLRPNHAPKKSPDTGYNTRSRDERLDRCRTAVNMQIGGHTRAVIAERLGIAPSTVKQLLKDGKFYADPTSDPWRLAAAEAAARARQDGQTKKRFTEASDLSAARAARAWGDADILFPDRREEHSGRSCRSALS